MLQLRKTKIVLLLKVKSDPWASDTGNPFTSFLQAIKAINLIDFRFFAQKPDIMHCYRDFEIFLKNLQTFEKLKKNI